jgi:YggT family protein
MDLERRTDDDEIEAGPEGAAASNPRLEPEDADAGDPRLGDRVIEEQTTVVNGEVHREVVERARTYIRSDADLQRLWMRNVRRTVYFIVHVSAIFILIRFFLLLTGANPENGFAQFIYGLTGILMAPFVGLFGPSPGPTYGAPVFEASALFAIAMYYLFAWIGVHLTALIVRRRSLRRVERQPLPPTTTRQ